MKIYLATANAHKKREFQEILKEHRIVVPSDEGLEFSADETGASFYENSLIKAKALWQAVRAPVIADDSGLCVDALGGAPGIYSARYAGRDFMRGRPDGKKISQEEQNLLLIEQTADAVRKMGGLQGLRGAAALKKARFLNGEFSCRYVCAMTLMLDPDRFFVAQETMEGALVEDLSLASGTGGFGYDPIVQLPYMENRTVAELSADEKNGISHRTKAARAILSIIKAVEISGNFQ